MEKYRGCAPGPCRGSARAGIVLLCVCALCMAHLSLGCAKRKESARAEKISNVKVWVTEKKSVRPYIETIGNLNPNDEVVVSSEADGIVTWMGVAEGTPVSRGQALAKVDDTDYRLNVLNYQATVKQAEANLMNLQIEHRRKEALFKEDLVTLQQFDDISTRLTIATHELQRSQVALSLARQRLSKSSIYAPISGVVKQRMVSAGDFVRTSMPVMTVVRVDPLKLSFAITEKDVSSLRIGQEVVFTVDSFPGREFRGVLRVMYPSLDERTRSLKAEALVPNDSRELKPGFFARVKVYTSTARQAVVIPATSVLYEGTKVKVFLQAGSRAREKLLRIGAKYGDMVEVLDGLLGGEKLIVVGQNSLTDGVMIHVVK